MRTEEEIRERIKKITDYLKYCQEHLEYEDALCAMKKIQVLEWVLQENEDE